MLIIRFIRTGKKNQPFFRIVITDKKNAPKGGNFLEILGFFNPLTKEKALKKERIKYWLSVGAKTSDRVYNLLISEKVIQGKKVNVFKKPKKKPEVETEQPKTEEKPKEEVKEQPKTEETKTEEKKETKENIEEKKKEEVKEKKEETKPEKIEKVIEEKKPEESAKEEDKKEGLPKETSPEVEEK
jgi:small subunit ribosomal protein S16